MIEAGGNRHKRYLRKMEVLKQMKEKAESLDTSIRFLSMGGGVNSTACLIRYHEAYDAVVFADTGAEKPYTLSYIEQYLKPFCRDHGIEWYTVRHKSGIPLPEYYERERMQPSAGCVPDSSR